MVDSSQLGSPARGSPTGTTLPGIPRGSGTLIIDDWPTDLVGKSIVVVNPLRAYWSYRFCGEAALTALDEGANVSWVEVPTSLRLRDSEGLQLNRSDRYQFLIFQDPSEVVISVLGHLGVETQDLQLEDPPAGLSLPKTLDELDSWQWRGAMLGRAVHASVSGQLFQRYLDLHDVGVVAAVKSQLGIAVKLFDAFTACFSELRPHFVVTTNDRALPSSVCVLAAQALGIPVRIVYWGSGIDTWTAYATSLYSEADKARHCRLHWAHVSPNTSRLEASISESEAWVSSGTDLPTGLHFDAAMTAGRAPARASRRRATFFTGSPWEFSGSLDQRSGDFSDQIEAFQAVTEVLRCAEWEVYIRHHPPHPALGDVGEAEAWAAFPESDNLHHVYPDSDVDSMSLAMSSDVNIVWTSSIGLRIIAAGLQVAVCGPAFWSEFGLGTPTRNKDQLHEFMRGESKVGAKNDLYPVLEYLRSHGRPVKQSTGLGSELRLRGELVFRPHLPKTVVRTMRRLRARAKSIVTRLRVSS
jgi:hypothetical protein